jgi:hypothetical protein
VICQSAPPASAEQRLQALERERGAVKKVPGASKRDAARDLPRHIWLAKTAAIGGNYTPFGGDTFPIIFQDGSYTKTAGSPAAT